MDKAGNYIYVIIILGSIILSFIQSAAKRKKQQQSQQSTTPIPRKKSLDEIFGELLGEEKPKPVVVQKLNVEKQQPQPIKPTVMNDSLAVKRQSFKPMEQQPQDTEKYRIDLTLEDVDDWQKAFVYSEIFNRKY